ncbi:MAG: hypothetical protein U0791_13210 [Gemmataceae bacterium]
MPALRSLIAVALVFAQAVASFGFPVVQTRYTVKACGCITPCGADSANCCCAKPKPEPKKPRCPKCIEREDTLPHAEPAVKWIAAFQSKQCRGETTASVVAELPAVPPADAETGRDFTRTLHTVSPIESVLISHISAIQDPPPRRS